MVCVNARKVRDTVTRWGSSHSVAGKDEAAVAAVTMHCDIVHLKVPGTCEREPVAGNCPFGTSLLRLRKQSRLC